MVMITIEYLEAHIVSISLSTQKDFVSLKGTDPAQVNFVLGDFIAHFLHM